ncbi:DUF3500 domain-containing protein [Dactylosporangium sp. CS-047395]|uniref:DUF3500 domain-containing protein n=1 Tax=Dactylosporangium sp. CS-047395 TaxID=3239936 RepID=UPI003D8B9552
MLSRLRVAAGLAACALVLAGCGSGDDTGSSPTATASGKTYPRTVAGVVEAAKAFLATLGNDEKASAQLDFAKDQAVAWSNLPCGSTCRPGVMFGDLDAEQVAAGRSVVATALGTGTGTGYQRVEQIFAADGYLGSVQGSSGPGGGMPSGGMGGPGGSGGPGGGMPGGSGGPGGGGGLGGYDSGNYYLAFLGEPSTTGTWQLHFGGHHLAVNLTYKAGKVEGATPFFVGVEPTSWTDADGTGHAPLRDMKDAMAALEAGLTTAEQENAKLTESYSDVLMGPGKDGQFPAKKAGVAVSALTADQRKLVLAAIEPWVGNADDATAAALMSTYESELDQTYVAWSGTLGLTKHADYVRIDGPSVWVEFVCQNGVVLQNQIHYHTVYRDHTRDYGGEFTFG